ncbi:MAG: hypothetical protein ACO1SX_27150, partial [Actinomycetota bacterium]
SPGSFHCAMPTESPYAALLELPENWDSYGAKPITPAAVETAARVAAVLKARDPQAMPLACGGVQLEWHADGVDVEIEIGADGEID